MSLPSVMADSPPSPELLELLGQLGDIEALGVDIDALIKKRLSPERKIENSKEDQELLIQEGES